MGSRLVGVHLIGETEFNQANSKSDVLGVIRLANADSNLLDVRGLIAGELPTFHLDYVFLTQERIPVWKHQEGHVSANEILENTGALFIARNFEKCRIGIRRSSGSAIGFVFADKNISLLEFRSEIHEQLLEGEFLFCDKNGWPVQKGQEDVLAGWDVISQGVVTLQLPLTKPPTPCLLKGNKDSRKRRKQSTGFTVQHDSRKEIVISYARSEADEHAKKLKEELEALGARVFLDQDDIVPGDDWQNKLNDAIQSCMIFVPLVTARYGNTTYTNKEVKLADYIGKFVIPVNFLKTWPPNHLAIQFASIQYINWRMSNEVQQGSRESDGEEEESIRVWESRSVERVANDIFNILQQCKIEESTFRNEFSVSLRGHQRALHSNFVPHAQVKSVIAPADSGTPLICPDVRQFIVISAHPHDRDFAVRLQSYLERNCYEAWCSLDVLSASQNMGHSSPSSSGTTPTTPLAVPMFSSQESQGPLEMCFNPPRPPSLVRIPSFQFSCSMDTVGKFP